MYQDFNTRYAMQSATPIPLDTVLARFPTIRQSEPWAQTSPRYEHISTADILDGLTREGFQIYSVQTAKTRNPDRADFVKHLIRLRQPGATARRVGDSIPEIILRNAHDGRGSYEALAGLMRLICLNGLMVGSMFEAYRVPHVGRDIAGRVIDATYSVVESFEPLAATVDAMRVTQLTRDESDDLARRAMAIRYGDESPYADSSLLVRRRSEDESNDLWTTFNAVQENLIRGGARGVTLGSNGRIRRTTMRPVRALDSSVSVNRRLWDLATEYLPGGKPAPRPQLIAA